MSGYPRTISLTDKAYRYLDADVVKVRLLDLPWYEDKPAGSTPDPATPPPAAAPREGGLPQPPSHDGGGAR